MSDELGALFALTEHASERVWSETRLGNPASHSDEIEIETLAAERIVEEELLAWQSSQPYLRASSRPPLSDFDPFGHDEPHSAVRRRARVLSKLGMG